MEKGVRDWDCGLGFEDWDCQLAFELEIGIGDRDMELGMEIGIASWIEDWN